MAPRHYWIWKTGLRRYERRHSWTAALQVKEHYWIGLHRHTKVAGLQLLDHRVVDTQKDGCHRDGEVDARSD